ncbi:hypothetical protein C0991_002777 [Blastosporella zonata]|nr:hypothetical protein C0991_002777 [Blastosporella zonata]
MYPIIVFALSLSSLVVSRPADNSAQEPLVFTNATISSGDFSYTGIRGPLGWAGLSDENHLCSVGTHQSPINLDQSVGSPPINPRVIIPDGYSDLQNLGTTVEAFAVGTTQLAGKVYQLKQYHFHSPSEHRINGEHYPLEVHFVHQAADGSRLVLGAVFDFTIRNDITTPFVYTLARQVLQIINPGTTTRVFNLRFAEIINLFQNTRLFQYSGSLTTPPCSEGVTWLVAQAPLAIDTSSYLYFKRVLKFNSRYTQNLLGQENLIKIAVDQFRRGAA